jgi:putative oxidoreductase
MFDRLGRHAAVALAALRIVSGLLFLAHGTQKLFDFPPGARVMPEFGSLLWVGGVLELALGALIALGLFTRPAAFLAAGEMAVAYWMFHAPQNLYPVNNGGDPAILYCFIFLYLVFAGPGALSLDHRRSGAGFSRRS